MLFKEVKDLQEKIDAYFVDRDPHPEEYIDYVYPLHETSGKTDYSQDYIEVTKMRWTEAKPYTVSSLAVFLGCSAQSLLNYKGKKKFFGTIQEALDKCRAYTEDYLYTGKNVTGAMFSARVNFKMYDDNPEKFREKGTGVLDLPGGLHFHNHVESKKDEYGS